MVWSNWQGAIWRGAAVMLLFWSGLAWTQTPVQRSAGEPTEPTMVVHENGKSTRCRVLETWQLPDGRKAHLLEALDTGEKITIVTEPAAPATPRAMPIRIFAWGQGRAAPPEGSPLPPHLRLDSGIVIRNEDPFPTGGVIGEGPAIVNRTDDTPLGGTFTGPGPRVVVERTSVRPIGAGILARLFPNRAGATQMPDEPQVIHFAADQTPAAPTNPLIQPQVPGVSGSNTVVQALSPAAPDAGNIQVKGTDTLSGNPPMQMQGGAAINFPGPLVSNGQGNGNMTPGIAPGTPMPPLVMPSSGVFPPAPPINVQAQANIVPPMNVQPQSNTLPPMNVQPQVNLVPPMNVQPQSNTLPSAPSVGNPLPATAVAMPLTKPSADPVPTVATTVAGASKPEEPKKSWHPGEKIASWWQTKSTKPEAIPAVPPAPIVVNPQASATPLAIPAAPPAGNPQTAKVDDKILPPANLDDKMKKADDFLTEQNKLADKQLKAKMDAIYKGTFSTAMNPATAPDLKKPEATPLAIPNSTTAKDDKSLPPPPPMPLAKEDIKQANSSGPEPRDMFGTAVAPATPPGRSVLDAPGSSKLPAPPQPRKEDPLMALDKLPTPPKANVLPPAAREFRPAPAPEMGSRNTMPPGAQSVLAARNGLDGPIAYVPQPVVTVPQPNRPPGPPDPALPNAPQLNAFVNAFSPPPTPKGAQQQMPQQMPQQGMMPQQAMMPYGNPMMQQMPPYGYGYPPAGYAMNPYAQQGPMMNPMMPPQVPYSQPMVASQGPTANYSRQYMGPMPPQNPFAPQTMPAGYGYPPQMMPQQQAIQPAAYQQQLPSQASQGQQVEQLLRVMRENAYPAQREWAAQMLANYEWRVHPQIVPALLQSAAQDPAATVRAGCVTCLGRMQAAVEPVFGTLHAMRSDIDPRVRSAVEQAFVNLGQTPMAPQ